MMPPDTPRHAPHALTRLQIRFDTHIAHDQPALTNKTLHARSFRQLAQSRCAPGGHTTVTGIPFSRATATTSAVPPYPRAGKPSHTAINSSASSSIRTLPAWCASELESSRSSSITSVAAEANLSYSACCSCGKLSRYFRAGTTTINEPPTSSTALANKLSGPSAMQLTPTSSPSARAETFDRNSACTSTVVSGGSPRWPVIATRVIVRPVHRVWPAHHPAVAPPKSWPGGRPGNL